MHGASVSVYILFDCLSGNQEDLVAAKSRKKWGGYRSGAGRKPEFGEHRTHRHTVFLSPEEDRKLREYAEDQRVWPGRALYLIVSRFLKRRS